MQSVMTRVRLFNNYMVVIRPLQLLLACPQSVFRVSYLQSQVMYLNLKLETPLDSCGDDSFGLLLANVYVSWLHKSAQSEMYHSILCDRIFTGIPDIPATTIVENARNGFLMCVPDNEFGYRVTHVISLDPVLCGRRVFSVQGTCLGAEDLEDVKSFLMIFNRPEAKLD